MAVNNTNKIILYVSGIILFSIIVIFLSIKILKISTPTSSIQYNIKYENNEIKKYSKPYFNNENLNKIVDDYIKQNFCINLEFSVYNINKTAINLYLNCGTPKSVIFNYKTDEIENFTTIITNQKKFSDSIEKLLNLKYPKFVTEEVIATKGVFDIRENQLIAYYNTKNYGNISIKVNNNEIKDLMKYEMHYDDAYENEKYTLDKNKKTIAFTFDDGPSTYDLEIIDLLANSHSTATFFMVGNRINNFKDSVFKMIENDMEIGNHSYNHKAMTKLSNTEIIKEINKTNETFYNLTGKEMTLFRAPYGAINSRVLLNTKMPLILWSIDTLDWQSRDANKVYDSIMNNVKTGDIVLMHSLYPSTVEAVKKVIPELYKQGYQIVSVSKLFELKDQKIEIGSSYRKIG